MKNRTPSNETKKFQNIFESNLSEKMAQKFLKSKCYHAQPNNSSCSCQSTGRSLRSFLSVSPAGSSPLRIADLPLEENYFIFTGGENCGLERLIAPELSCAFLRDTEGKVGTLMRTAGDLCETNGERAFWKVQAVFMEIIQLLTSAHRTSEGKWDICKTSDEITFADEVEAYLRKNIANNVKTSDIARYMKVSESSLNHRFKNDTEISPIARLIEMRMDFAKSLLLKGEKLTTIADMTGFYDE